MRGGSYLGTQGVVITGSNPSVAAVSSGNARVVAASFPELPSRRKSQNDTSPWGVDSRREFVPCSREEKRSTIAGRKAAKEVGLRRQARYQKLLRVIAFLSKHNQHQR